MLQNHVCMKSSKCPHRLAYTHIQHLHLLPCLAGHYTLFYETSTYQFYVSFDNSDTMQDPNVDHTQTFVDLHMLVAFLCRCPCTSRCVRQHTWIAEEYTLQHPQSVLQNRINIFFNIYISDDTYSTHISSYIKKHTHKHNTNTYTWCSVGNPWQIFSNVSTRIRRLRVWGLDKVWSGRFGSAYTDLCTYIYVYTIYIHTYTYTSSFTGVGRAA